MRATIWMFRAALVGGMFVSSSASAQGTSVITGIVTDAVTGRPVPDVVVTASSPMLQGEQMAVTDATGLYRIDQLPAGVYSITVEKSSYRPLTAGGVTVQTDRTIRVNLQMPPEVVESEPIVVTARPPIVDVGSSTTGVVVGSDFIENVALVRPAATGAGVRSFESLAAAAPQVQADAYGFGITGATSPENQVLIDGLSVIDPAKGINALGLPIDFFQEVYVITGGYMAEYGRAGGGILNAVIKSGSNEYHGSIFANYTPGLLSPSSPPAGVEGQSKVLETKLWNMADFGAELGGPIIKDRLWFYAGLSPSFTRYQRHQFLNQYLIDEAGSAYQRTSSGAIATERIAGSDKRLFDDRSSLSFVAKLTYLIDADHRISVQAEGNSGDRHLPTFNQLIAGVRYPTTTTAVSAKYSGGFFDRHVLVDVTGGWFHQSTHSAGIPDDGTTIGSTTGSAGTPQLALWDPNLSITDLEQYPQSVIDVCTKGGTLTPGSPRPCPATSVASPYPSGGFGYLDDIVSDRFMGKASVAYLARALGHHVFKAGVDFERDVYAIKKAYSGGVSILQSRPGPQTPVISYSDFNRYSYLSGPDAMSEPMIIQLAPATNQFAGYVQDSWAIMDVVTLNVGLRYDNQKLFDGAGNLGMSLNDMWSPRIGAVWDFTNQGRSKIFANYARSYASIPLDLADRSLSGESQAGVSRGPPCDPTSDPNLIHQGACVDPASYLPTGTRMPSRSAVTNGGGRTAIDPNLRPESKDEIIVGAEYEFLPDFRAGLTYTKSWMNDIIEDMSPDNGSTYFIGNPGSGIAKVSGFTQKAIRNYDAVTVLALKAFSDGWMAQASYTWSRLYGNWSGFYQADSPNAQLDPGINTDFDIKAHVVNSLGPLPADRTHQVKVFVAKEFVISPTLSLHLGLTYDGASGPPISYLGWSPVPALGIGKTFLLPRGAAGRLPWVHTFNLRFGVKYKLDKDRGLGFAIDGYNFFNLAAVTNVDQNYTTVPVLPYEGAGGLHALCADTSVGCSPEVVFVDRSGGRGGTLPVSWISPNFKQPVNNFLGSAYQPPMQWRLSIKLTF